MKKNRVEKYATTTAFALVLGGLCAMNFALQKPAVLESERRLPAALPALSQESFADGSFMKGFEQWAQDGFAFREQLRTLRAEMVFHGFLETDKDGLYLGDSGAGRFERINEEAWRQTLAKINRLADAFSEGRFGAGSFRLYAAVIPDKSVYAGSYLPGYEPDTAHRLLSELLAPEIRQVDLTDALFAEAFYRTDLHWSQPELYGVAARLGEAMNSYALATKRPEEAYFQDALHTLGSFRGVYAGQLALPLSPDTLSYVSNPYIDSAAASYLDPKTGVMTQGQLYYPEALTAEGGDPYDFFLNGPQPLIVLENQMSASGRTLYLFRDSFGSSLAPLLLCPYDRVVLIDLRYIDSRVLEQYVDFQPGADVLFLYSSQIMNHPSVLLTG